MTYVSMLKAFIVATLPLTLAACSGGDDDAGPGGGSGPEEDFMEVTLDGELIPTEPDPTTFATYSEDFIALGMQAPAPGGGFLDDDFVINVETNGMAEGTYPFAEDVDLRELGLAGTRAGSASVFDFDGTEYKSTLEGSVILDDVSTGTDEDGDLDLRWVSGSFSGTFESEAGEQRTASVRFTYVSLE